MNCFKLNTPVAFLIFNRPNTTLRVFEEIRRARPSKLLVVADGARVDRPDEADKCLAVRAIIDSVDWPCEVLKNYSDVNLGCKTRISSGLDWVFEQVEEAIILEDDCLPHPSFFRFCEELLSRYRYDERIMQISGCNFQCGGQQYEASYYFSKHVHIWGWASWRRAWNHYDVKISSLPSFLNQNQIRNIWPDRKMHKLWLNCFKSTYNGAIDTWDYQWIYTIWSQNGLTVLPTVNLISNLGFGDEATHTKHESNMSNRSTYEISAVTHPEFILQNVAADNCTFNNFIYKPLHKRFISYLLRRFKKIIKY